eukprot:5351033-Pleurochrysis_carterae.AAC.1
MPRLSRAALQAAGGGGPMAADGEGKARVGGGAAGVQRATARRGDRPPAGQKLRRQPRLDVGVARVDAA